MADKKHDTTALRNAALTLAGRDWEWWTSNSYRRLTFKEGQNTRDGGALHGSVHPVDKWPDVAMAPGVQTFIERASPKAILALLDRIAELEAALGPMKAFIDYFEGDATPLFAQLGMPVVDLFNDADRAAAAMGGK